jgi:hypothetical protein
MRLSSLGRWELDQFLLACTEISLTDDINGYSADMVWMSKIRIKWQGHINWERPWLVEITLLVIE